MNEVLKALRRRRSVRKYDGTPINEDVLKSILEAGLTAPTGDNFKTVECLVIQDKPTLHELASIRKAGTRMLDTAGAAILVLGNAEKSDLWVEDASIAMAYMHLAADSLGLGSCWIQMRGRDDREGKDLEPVLQEKFGIPKNMRTLAILSLGNIESHPAGHTADEVDWKKVHYKQY